MVDAMMDAAGYSRLKPHQIENIYVTNTSLAYGAGQIAQMAQVSDEFPYWRYSATMDGHTRPEHAALHGKIFKNGDFTFWPPISFRCRCSAIPMTARQAGKYGVEAFPDRSGKRELFDTIPNKAFAGDKQRNYMNWLAKEYKGTDQYTRALIDQTLQVMKKEIKALPEVNGEKENPKIPVLLAAGSEYIKNTKIAFSKDFFNLFNTDSPIKLTITTKGKGSYYSPADKEVVIVNSNRSKWSAWHRESVIYHEFGHALDFQRNLHNSTQIKSLMKIWQGKLGKKNLYSIHGRYRDSEGKIQSGQHTIEVPQIAYISQKLNDLYRRIDKMDEKIFKKRGITKADVCEQIAATQDTIKSINIQYGWGHSTAYFKKAGTREAEFIAHCFENKFIGNMIFKKYLPDLYQTMIEYIDGLQ